jgi:hypothetical protein
MKSLYSFIPVLLAGALIAFSPTDGTAGTVGKVVGVVEDDAGNPLPGANVVVEGTQRGATTDADGYFAILGVDPGRQRVTASMVGYNTSTVENVSVKADFTTTVDFALSETAIEAVEMVVTARRPPVEPDRTSSRYVVDIFEIENVPLIRSTEDLIELQPGVSLDGALRLRGSDHTQNTTMSQSRYYEVDGIKMVNDDGYFNQRLWTPLNKGALQEVSIIVGGMDAEYGTASGGVVSLVSKEGGGGFGGLAEVRIHPPGKKHFGPNVYDSGEFKHLTGLSDPWSDEAFVNYARPAETSEQAGQPHHVRDDDYTERWGQFVEGSVNGPLSDNASFFLNGRTSRVQAQFPDRWGYEPKNYQGTGNLTYRPSANVKLKLGGILGYNEATYGFQTMTGNPDGSTGGNAWWEVFYPHFQALFMPPDFSTRGTVLTDERVVYLTATHSLSPKTFYDVRASFQQTTLGSDTIPEGQHSSFRRTTDDWGFLLLWNDHSAIDENRKRITLKVDLTSQVQRSILGKAGVEVIRYSVFQNNFQQMGDWLNRWRQLVGVGDPHIGQDPIIMNHLGAYVQTKMEFEGLVINAGLRADALHAGDIWVQDGQQWWHWWRMRRFENVPFRSTDWITNVSPRLGISHPITERSTIRFYSGVLHEMPSKQFLYDRGFRSRTVDTDVNGNGQIDQTELGNSLEQPHNQRYATTDLDPQRTVTFEAGVDWNFAGDYVLSSTAYFKDLEGQIMQRRYYWAADVTLWPDGVTKDNSFRSGNISTVKTSRGFELSFKKMFSQMTSLNLSWNTQWLKAGQGTWTVQFFHPSSFVDSNEFFLGVDSNSDGTETPKVPTAAERADYKARAQANFDAVLARVGADNGPAGYVLQPMRVEGYDQTYADHRNVYRLPKPTNGIDRRNYAALQFLFSAPADYKMKALAGSRVTMLYRIQGGTPYNYTPPDAPTQLRNAPINTVTDLNVEKDFSFGQSGTATAFVEVRNLFDQRDELPTTSNYVLYGLSAFEPDDANFLKYGDYRDMTRYSLGQAESYGAPTGGGVGEQPRLFVLGARLSF